MVFLSIGFIVSCGGTSQLLTPEQVEELHSSFHFEDQDPSTNGINGPVTVDIPDGILAALKGSAAYDSLAVYISPNSEVTDFTNMNALTSKSIDDLFSGFNLLGAVEANTYYQDGDKLILAFASNTEVLNSGISLEINDFVLVGADASNVKQVEVLVKGVAEKPMVSDIPVELNIRISNVQFAFDKSVVLPQFIEQLIDELSDYRGDFANMNVYIAGHTDEAGTKEYNLALGTRRALAVKQVLMSMGFSGANILDVSFGEERPLDPNDTVRAQAINRRAAIAMKVMQ